MRNSTILTVLRGPLNYGIMAYCINGYFAISKSTLIFLPFAITSTLMLTLYGILLLHIYIYIYIHMYYTLYVYIYIYMHIVNGVMAYCIILYDVILYEFI